MISPEQFSDLREMVRQWQAKQPAPESIGELEQCVMQATRVAGLAMMEEGIERVDAGNRRRTKVAPCRCGASARFMGYRPREIITLYGVVDLERAYHYCRRCRTGLFLWDDAQGLNTLAWTPMVKALVSELAGRLPYAEAARVMGRFTGLGIEESCCERIVAEVGGRLRSEESEQMAGYDCGQITPLVRRAPERLYVSMDGTSAHIDGSWHEVKTGVVHEARPGPDGIDRACGQRYVAAQEPAERFGERLYVGAAQAGVEQACEVVVAGDGAEWIWNVAAHHYPQATQILDCWHARQHIHALASAYYGEGSAKGRRWADDHCRWLEQRGPGTLLRALKRMKPKSAQQAEAIRRERGYCERNAQRMQYPRYRAAGMMIGSGPVEAGCKTVVGGRLKGAGMRWSRAGADAVLAIRTALLSNQDNRILTASRAA